jgi:hypothetical protein
MEAVVESYNYPKCEKCGEDKNMYGGCRCNGYTTAFNAVENQHIHQHGALYDPAELMEMATGLKPQARFHLEYLRGRYVGE